ncbi:hypothetical protein [Enterococcus sp. LJL51]
MMKAAMVILVSALVSGLAANTIVQDENFTPRILEKLVLKKDQ